MTEEEDRLDNCNEDRDPGSHSDEGPDVVEFSTKVNGIMSGWPPLFDAAASRRGSDFAAISSREPCARQSANVSTERRN